MANVTLPGCVLSPVGLSARKWGSLSLLPDCVITCPVFLTPQTRRGRVCPHALRLPKACHTLLRRNWASAARCSAGTGGGRLRAAVSCKRSQCPGLPGWTPTWAKRQEWQERRAPGGDRLKSPERGTQLHTPSTPSLRRGACPWPRSGAPPPARIFLCGFSCWPQLDDPGSPLLTAAVIPPPGWVSFPAGRGSGCGCQRTGPARSGHFEVCGWATNSAPSVAGGELRQLRDRPRGRGFCSAAGDVGRRQRAESSGGRGAGRAAAPVPTSSGRAAGRAGSAAGAPSRAERGGAREPRPAPCAAACWSAPGARPPVLRLGSINSRLQLLLGAHTLTRERRKVSLKVSAAAAPRSASGREPKEMVLPGQRSAVFYEKSDQGRSL
ncbi:PREDICTED: uncharacterized protein LOC102010146 [Chinchilla lanigera]|uniref:uncharacterized protein LOC102010146 n=1 Tax=Chinchilla lanigera TaxID=34839 RepID=UPI000695B02A|nr:PREDICTED: uncharacterized protein LOC102010146 [Chinchilla lanigera]